MDAAARFDEILGLYRPETLQRAGRAAVLAEARVAAYGRLSPAEAGALADDAVRFTDEGLRDEVLIHLACYCPGTLAAVHARLARTGVHHPGKLYWRAGGEARDALLAALANGGGRADHLLLCLAWIGDEEVQRTFAAWRDAPPAWAAELFVPPESYAAEAGWELTPTGGRRELCTLDSHRLVRVTGPLDGAFDVAAATDARCPWLPRPLTRVLDLPADHPALRWLGLDVPRLSIDACDRSACFTDVFCELGIDGPRWSDASVRPDSLGRDGDWRPLPPIRMTTAPLSTPFWGDWMGWEHGASKLGGFPSWLDDATYPTCPGCARLMPFVGQLDADELEPHRAGIYFLFTCAPCRIAATGYQQT